MNLGSSLDGRLGANPRPRPGIAATASWDSKTVFSELVNSRKEFSRHHTAPLFIGTKFHQVGSRHAKADTEGIVKVIFVKLNSDLS